MFFKILLSIFLVFTVITAFNTKMDFDCSSNYYILPYIVPRHYDITLTPITHDYFSGASSVLLEVSDSSLYYTSQIILHAHKLFIYNHTIMLVAHTDNESKKLSRYRYCAKSHILILYFDSALGPGKYTLSMTFLGSLRNSEGFIMKNHTDRDGYFRHSYVTLFNPTGARRAFPCWDEPTWKSTFNISVIHPEKYRALSITPQAMQVQYSVIKYMDKEEKIVQTTFETTSNLATRYLTIAIMEAVRINSPYTIDQYPMMDKIILWCTEERKYQMEIARLIVPKVINFLIEKMGFTWKGPTINLVVFPNLPTKVMGSWGLAVLREDDVIDKGSFIGRDVEVQRTIAYAIIRQFLETFGSTTTWFKGWIMEGLALSLSYYVAEKTNPNEQHLEDLFVLQVRQPVLHNNGFIEVSNLYETSDPFYSSFINNKASVIMHMLQYTVGKAAFDQGIAEFLKLNRSDTADDLWQILENKTSKGRLQHAVKHLISYWATRDNYPILATMEPSDYKGTSIVQYPFPKANANNKRAWVIPVTYTTQTKQDFSDFSPKLWLIKSILKVNNVDPEDWIIFNIQQTGFYRVNYHYDQWKRIVEHLNNNRTEIHRLNRAQIIDDAYHLMMLEELKYDDFLGLVENLWMERDYAPWHTVSNILHYMSPFFNFPEMNDFKGYIARTLRRYVDSWKYDEQTLFNEKTNMAPLLVMYWACKFDDFLCRRTAHIMLRKYLEKPSQNLVRPGWENWVYCGGLMNANSETWNQLVKIIIDQKLQMLEYLTCFKDNNVVQEFLKSVTSNIDSKWKYLEHEQLIRLYRSFMKRHATKCEVFLYILENFEEFMPGLKELEKIGIILMNVYSKCHINKILKLVDTKYSENATLKLEVKLMTELRRDQLQMQKSQFLDVIGVRGYDIAC